MRVVTFGEVMIRLAPEEFLRVRQVIPGRLEATFGGGELNVAVSVAQQGGESAFLTALPDNVLTDSLVQDIRKLGVDASLVRRSTTGRFGIYFVETGANQRGGTVTYDRDGSSIALQTPDFYDFDAAFDGATWFHITGITPAISENAAAAAMRALETAARRRSPDLAETPDRRSPGTGTGSDSGRPAVNPGAGSGDPRKAEGDPRTAGLTVSCDLNFRKKLWNWRPGTPPGELARETMRQIVPFVDVVIANEEDAEMCLGIAAPHSDVESGRLNLSGYQQVAAEIVSQFPNVKQVAITLRESFSASHNNWGAMLYDAGTQSACFAPTDADGEYRPYEIRNIVDRVGAGDSFAGGLIVALNAPELSEPQTALRYAVAASCLKHSIKGDFNYATRAEIEALMTGSGSGRVQR